MAESFVPFAAGPGVIVTEAQWQRLGRALAPTGVVLGRLNGLAVTADGTGLRVVVASGGALVDGFYYDNDAAKTITLATADPTRNRLDRIVVRLDRTARTITTAAVTGTPAASPTPPALTQTDLLYEVPLATVTVPAGAGVITAQNVADTRLFGRGDHGQLDGLGDDDHPQYLNVSRGDQRYLPVQGKAADSDRLDGLDSSAFLRTTGKAADSDRLDGLDSSAFLRSNGKAVDSDLLDGQDSSFFYSPANPPPLQAQGSYVGSQEGERIIGLPFTPAVVYLTWIDNNGVPRAAQSDVAGSGIGLGSSDIDARPRPTTTARLFPQRVGGGFRVRAAGGTGDTNEGSTTYHYLAIRQ